MAIALILEDVETDFCVRPTRDKVVEVVYTQFGKKTGIYQSPGNKILCIQRGLVHS